MVYNFGPVCLSVRLWNVPTSYANTQQRTRVEHNIRRTRTRSWTHFMTWTFKRNQTLNGGDYQVNRSLHATIQPVRHAVCDLTTATREITQRRYPKNLANRGSERIFWSSAANINGANCLCLHTHTHTETHTYNVTSQRPDTVDRAVYMFAASRPSWLRVSRPTPVQTCSPHHSQPKTSAALDSRCYIIYMYIWSSVLCLPATLNSP